MSDKPLPNMRPALYATAYGLMRPIAYEAGYTLAVHGSLKSDMDIVAIPWTSEAVSADDLIKRFVEELKFMDLTEEKESRSARPHGRLCVLLAWDAGLAFDISIMPRLDVIYEDGKPNYTAKPEPAKCSKCQGTKTVTMVKIATGATRLAPCPSCSGLAPQPENEGEK